MLDWIKSRAWLVTRAAGVCSVANGREIEVERLIDIFTFLGRNHHTYDDKPVTR